MSSNLRKIVTFKIPKLAATHFHEIACGNLKSEVDYYAEAYMQKSRTSSSFNTSASPNTPPPF